MKKSKYRNFFTESEKSMSKSSIKRAETSAADEIHFIRLSEIREQLGIKQTDVKGFTQSNVSRLESRKDLKLSTLIKYLKKLGLHHITITASSRVGNSEKDLLILET
ncbi:MAG: hypothetical protein A2583_03545 [Bdellovibrionales bacterium RIFOXYD1_FULL_53_11]|nr:MAG: hypothetical protein A2583_03545 [Bdellovibrionales bacterium RIFOXYD1_FULL_53_11]